jgi:2-haloacid dehalogenase
MSATSRPHAVLFDAYGTLFRLDTIEQACAAVLARSQSSVPASEFALLWRAKQLEYSVHRSLMGEAHYRNFREITAEALDYTLARFNLDISPSARDTLLRAWMTPTADPAARTVLSALNGVPCAILSNGEPLMLEEATRAAGLWNMLDAILSADRVRSYKPHPRVYALGTSHVGLPAHEIAFVSANGWDIAGAGAFGYRTCWINRADLPAERHGPPPTWTVPDLAGVPAILGFAPGP